jgi:hypothetical protein
LQTLENKNEFNKRLFSFFLPTFATLVKMKIDKTPLDFLWGNLGNLKNQRIGN